MRLGRVSETDLMPRLVGGDTERCCGKLKNRNSFSKPSFELGPSVSATCAKSNLFNLGRHKVRAQHYRELTTSALTEWSRAVA
jgi:hypothetical protein